MPRRRKLLAITTLSLAALGAAAYFLAPSIAILLPHDTFRGPLPITPSEHPDLPSELRAHVQTLAADIGERNLAHPTQLRAAENYIAAELARAGYRVSWQTYRATTPLHTPEKPDEHLVSNLSAEITGSLKPTEIVVIGAHYDSVNNFKGVSTPGANDNASGTASALSLARLFSSSTPQRTLRFVFFTNEEPPYFWTDQMGSLVYARDAHHKHENIVAMLSLETMGYFSDAENSQSFPPGVGLAYPSTGNFIGFIGFHSSETLVRRCVETFRAAGEFPAEGAALATLVPRIGSSDHWSFWKQGYPALMVTDTAPYRYAHYHKPTDTPDKLNYEAMSRVVRGLEKVIQDLTQATTDTGSGSSAPAPEPEDSPAQ
jgi:Zn-dependent M28 family amino/carboxypeptidase